MGKNEGEKEAKRTGAELKIKQGEGPTQRNMGEREGEAVWGDGRMQETGEERERDRVVVVVVGGGAEVP